MVNCANCDNRGKVYRLSGEFCCEYCIYQAIHMKDLFVLKRIEGDQKEEDQNEGDMHL